MGFAQFIAAPKTERGTGIKELDRVELTADTEAEGYLLPKGAQGTVVLTYGDGEGYEVEFTSPFHAVVGVPSNLLVRI